jgi:predicted GNAT family acetyltransferase
MSSIRVTFLHRGSLAPSLASYTLQRGVPYVRPAQNRLSPAPAPIASPGMRIERHTDPAAYDRLVTPLLLRDEARYNLALAITGRLAAGEAFGDAPPVLLSLHDGGELTGMAVMTPPFNVLVDAVPAAAAVPLAEYLVGEAVDAPGTLGPPEVVEPFAERLCALTGRTPRVTREEGVFRLRTVVPPRPTTGALRVATAADRALIDAWDDAFMVEVGLPQRRRGALAERAAQGLVWLWEDGSEPVAMVGCAGLTPNGARIGPVYTDPARRGRGYASAATAAVTQRFLDSGRTYCFLYTDLTNPTSNKIYRAIGYEHVADVRELSFD